MKRIAAYLASAALGAVLIGSGPAWAQNWGWSSEIGWHGYPYNADNYAYNYGYPYNYAYGYGYPYPVTPTRSVAATDTLTPIATATPIHLRL